MDALRWWPRHRPWLSRRVTLSLVCLRPRSPTISAHTLLIRVFEFFLDFSHSQIALPLRRSHVARLLSFVFDDLFSERLWIGWPGATFSESQQAPVTADLAKLDLVPVFLDEQLYDNFYTGCDSLSICLSLFFFLFFCLFEYTYVISSLLLEVSNIGNRGCVCRYFAHSNNISIFW